MIYDFSPSTGSFPQRLWHGVTWPIRWLLRQRLAFAVTAVLLLVAATGLNWTVRQLQLHFLKQRVETREPLTNLPPIIGSWVQLAPDEPLNEAMQEALKADQYVFRTYVNAAVVGQTPEKLREEFAGLKTAKEREERLRSYYRGGKGSAVLSFSLTYYTGKADTVAHIPEVCYTSSGSHPTDSSTKVDWKLGRPAGRTQAVRTVSFEDDTGASNAAIHVAYFFQANGQYYSDSLMARAVLTDLFAKYAYYAKIELSMIGDKDKADIAMQDFLALAMPGIEKVLPDWNALAGKAAAQPVPVEQKEQRNP